MWMFFQRFNDPRLRQERLFIYIFLPIILLLTGFGLYALLRERLFPELAVSDGESAPVAAVVQQERASPTPSETAATPSPAPAGTPSNLDRGQAALEQGDSKAAREFLTLAIRENARSDQAHNGLGIVDFMDKNPSGAVKNFSTAIAINGSNAVFHLNRAEALRLLDKQTEAVADLQAAMKLDPNNAIYPNKILLTRIEGGDKDGVFREVSTNIGLGLNLGQADWLAGAAAIELQSGNIQHCVGYLEALRKLVGPAIFNVILADRFFDPYRQAPEFVRFQAAQSNQ